MKNLNTNERKALAAIVADCDELDGWGFTRIHDMVTALAEEFNGNYQIAGGYIKALMNKGLVEIEPSEDEVWVNPDVFYAFC